MRALLPVLLFLPALARGQLLIRDEATSLGRPWTLSFLGAGVTCAGTGSGASRAVSCTIPGGGGGSGLPSDPSPCSAGQYVYDQNATGVLACRQVGYGELSGVPGAFTPAAHTHGGADVTSPVASANAATSASTANALAFDPANCLTAGWYAVGVTASGTAECTNAAVASATSASVALTASSASLADSANALATDLPLSKITDDATAGKCLLSGGAGGYPAWTACPAGTIADGSIAPAKLAPGVTTPDNTKFYRGDGTWQPDPPHNLMSGTHADTDFNPPSQHDTIVRDGNGKWVHLTLAACSGAGKALTYDTTTQTFGCNTIAGVGTMSRLTGTWTSSASANTLGIVGTGGVPLTSPTYGAGAPFSFWCAIRMTRPSTANQPRYGVQSSGTVTSINVTAYVGLAGTAPLRTENPYELTGLATASCAANCTNNVITGGRAAAMNDLIEGNGVMNAQGTLSIVMAPSAAAAHTAQIGSYCIWY